MPDGATFSTPDNTTPFVVLGMPRSRTAWLSKVLSYGGFICLHEPSPDFRDLADLINLLHAPNVGISDSGLTLLWRQIVAARPDVRIVAVRRPIADVIDSCHAVGLHGIEGNIERIERALTEVEQRPGTLCVDYDDLNHFDCVATIFAFCLRQALPLDRWSHYQDLNIQADVGQTFERVAANIVGIRRVFGEAMTA